MFNLNCGLSDMLGSSCIAVVHDVHIRGGNIGMHAGLLVSTFLIA